MTREKLSRLIVWCTLILLFCVNSHAQTWEYEVQPGDTLWDIADEYLIDVTYYLQLQKINKVKDPYLLQTGRKITAPVSWLGSLAGKARIISKAGTVNIVTQNQRIVKAAVNYKIKANDELLTSDDGLVTIEFADKSKLTVNPKTHLVFKTLKQSSDGKIIKTNIAIHKGRIEANVIPQNFSQPRFIIQTPAAVTAVRGTLFRVGVDESTANTVTEVLSGRVEVIGNNSSQLLSDGYSSQTIPGRSPGEPLKLLDGPVIRDIGIYDTQLGHLEWETMDKAKYYRVRVAADQNFYKVIYDTVVASNQVDDIYFLRNGKHYASVRAANEFDMEGRDSVAAIEVQVYPLPPVIVSPKNLTVSGKTLPKFLWNVLAPDVNQVQFQLSKDDQFANLIVDEILARTDRFDINSKLEPGNYYWRIASINEQGRGAFSATTVLTIK